MSKYEEMILKKGIMWWDREKDVYPKNFNCYRGGYAAHQHPLQLSALFEYLEDKEINSYLEIGVDHGGTWRMMDEQLRSRNGNLISIGFDKRIPEHYREWKHSKMGLFVADSRLMNPFMKYPFDLVFIDGDHSPGAVKRDWRNYGQYAKICVLHDIANKENGIGVLRYWKELKRTLKGKNFIEFKQAYPKYEPRYGIGVIENDANA